MLFDTAQVDYKASTTVSSYHGDAEEAADEACAAAAPTASPKKDTGVQTGTHVKCSNFWFMLKMKTSDGFYFVFVKGLL